MKREEIAIDMHTLKSDPNSKYFYINNQKQLLNLLNKTKSIRIPNLQNQKIVIAIIKQSKIPYLRK